MTPPAPLPSVVAAQLVLVRSLVDRARGAANEKSEVSLMAALLLADLAVETLIKICVTQTGIPYEPKDPPNALLDKLSDRLPAVKALSQLSTARTLRRARNGVQHEGVTVSEASAHNHVRDADALLTALADTVLGVDFAMVTAASLVQTPEIRAALTEALQRVRAGSPSDLAEGAVYAIAAFELMVARWRHWLRRAIGAETRVTETFGPQVINFAVAHVFDDAPEGLEPLHARGDDDGDWGLLAMGIRPGELLRIQALAGRVHDRLEDQELPQGVVAAEVVFVAEAIARCAWNLEATQPEMLRPIETA